jgi:hypothetical protein
MGLDTESKLGRFVATADKNAEVVRATALYGKPFNDTSGQEKSDNQPRTQEPIKGAGQNRPEQLAETVNSQIHKLALDPIEKSELRKELEDKIYSRLSKKFGEPMSCEDSMRKNFGEDFVDFFNFRVETLADDWNKIKNSGKSPNKVTTVNYLDQQIDLLAYELAKNYTTGLYLPLEIEESLKQTVTKYVLPPMNDYYKFRSVGIVEISGEKLEVQSDHFHCTMLNVAKDFAHQFFGIFNKWPQTNDFLDFMKFFFQKPENHKLPLHLATFCNIEEAWVEGTQTTIKQHLQAYYENYLQEKTEGVYPNFERKLSGLILEQPNSALTMCPKDFWNQIRTTLDANTDFTNSSPENIALASAFLESKMKLKVVVSGLILKAFFTLFKDQYPNHSDSNAASQFLYSNLGVFMFNQLIFLIQTLQESQPSFLIDELGFGDTLTDLCYAYNQACGEITPTLDGFVQWLALYPKEIKTFLQSKKGGEKVVKLLKPFNDFCAELNAQLIENGFSETEAKNIVEQSVNAKNFASRFSALPGEVKNLANYHLSLVLNQKCQEIMQSGITTRDNFLKELNKKGQISKCKPYFESLIDFWSSMTVKLLEKGFTKHQAQQFALGCLENGNLKSATNKSPRRVRDLVRYFVANHQETLVANALDEIHEENGQILTPEIRTEIHHQIAKLKDEKWLQVIVENRKELVALCRRMIGTEINKKIAEVIDFVETEGIDAFTVSSLTVWNLFSSRKSDASKSISPELLNIVLPKLSQYLDEKAQRQIDHLKNEFTDEVYEFVKGINLNDLTRNDACWMMQKFMESKLTPQESSYFAKPWRREALLDLFAKAKSEEIIIREKVVIKMTAEAKAAFENQVISEFTEIEKLDDFGDLIKDPDSTELLVKLYERITKNPIQQPKLGKSLIAAKFALKSLENEQKTKQYQNEFTQQQREFVSKLIMRKKQEYQYLEKISVPAARNQKHRVETRIIKETPEKKSVFRRVLDFFDRSLPVGS